MTDHLDTVWIFCGDKSQFPGGVFSSKELAEEWITNRRLSGVLTEYPVNTGVYDWALMNDFFKPKRPDQSSPEFIGGFTSSHQKHYHYVEGKAS